LKTSDASEGLSPRFFIAKNQQTSNMRTTKIFTIAIVTILASFTIQSYGQNNWSERVLELPCIGYDDDRHFRAVGIATGHSDSIPALQISALANAQQIIRMKFTHWYKGIVEDYYHHRTIDGITESESQVESTGRQTIDMLMSDTTVYCVKISEPDRRGNVTYYIGIAVSKVELRELNHNRK
jgi:hypothetical protein